LKDTFGAGPSGDTNANTNNDHGGAAFDPYAPIVGQSVDPYYSQDAGYNNNAYGGGYDNYNNNNQYGGGYD